MNHLNSFFHAFEHNHQANTISSELSDLQQDSGSSESCLFCKTYLNLDYIQNESFTYSLSIPECISQDIIGREKQLLSVTIHKKKSRSPPFFNI